MSGFSLYPRKCKSGKSVFYVQFKKADGCYGTAKSTKQTTRRKAQEWAEIYLLKNGTPMPGQDITLEKYSEGFYDWQSSWALNKRIEGHRIGEQHCLARQDIIKNRI